MLRLTKRVFAILFVCSLALCAFGTAAFAEETVTETIYLDPTSAGGVRPGTADYTGALEFNTTTGTGSLFQYTLANLEIPAGETLKSAHFQFVTTASPNGKFMQFQSLNCEAALPAVPSYGDLTANNFTVASTFVQSQLTAEQTSGVTMWMNRSEEVTSTSSACMNVDVTQALTTAISGGKDYFNLLVYPYAGYYVAGVNANGWTPYGGGNGVLVITTEKVATVDILGDTDGVVSYKEDTQFAITANVTESSAALDTVVLTVKDESTQDVQTYDAPTINGTEYCWNFSAGLEPGTYIATVTATDVAGTAVSDSVTIEIRSATGTVYIPSNMLVSNGAGNNFQILNGALSHVQYDLGSYLPENSRVTDAKWYFGKSSAFTVNGTLLFKEITNQEKYDAIWTATLPEGVAVASSWTKTVGSVDTLYAQGTKMTNGSDYAAVSSAAGYYVTVPMTDVVAASWAAGNDYYGFGVMFDAGTNVVLGRWGGTGAYWPMLEVTYEEYDAPASVVINGATEGVINVKEDEAFDFAANVTKGTLDISSVDLYLIDENGAMVEDIGQATVTNTTYTWAINGLNPGSYTAIVMVIDINGNTVEETVTVLVESNTTTVYIPANMLVSNGAGNQFQILNGALSHVQYDLGSYLPEYSRITDANWYFGKSSAFTANGTLLFKEITNQEKYDALWTNTLPENVTIANSWTKTVGSIDTLYAEGTKMTNGNGADAVTSQTGYFVTVPMTSEVATSWAAGNDYYGFGVMLDGGTNVFLSRWAGNGAYWPMLEVTYEEYDAPPMVDIKGDTNSNISVKENTAFNVLADVTKGKLDIANVGLTIVNGDGEEISGIGEATVTEGVYSWAISGLTQDTYTASVVATDAKGNTAEDTITITVPSSSVSVVSKADLLAQVQTTLNITINDTPSYFQHTLPELPDGAVVTSAKWCSSGNHVNADDGVFTFYKMNSDTKFEGFYKDEATVSQFAALTEETEFISSASVSGIQEVVTEDGNNVTRAVVDITDAVKAAYDNGETNFGYMVKLDAGYSSVSYYETTYRPILVITYEITELEPVVSEHQLTVDAGVADASVTVSSGNATLIIAAYDSNGKLLAVTMDDTVEDFELSISLTETSAATFKSFVWNNKTGIAPLTPAIIK